jgi:hypothetical protein
MTASAPEVGALIEGTSSEASGRSEQHEATRARIVATIPATYHPTVHFLVPGVLGLAVLAASVWLLDAVRPVEWLTIPITLFLGFGFEWRIHKSVLHERLPLLGFLYVRHELHHHVIYRYDDMKMRSNREWRLVLMPTYAIVLVFVMMIPIVAALWRFVTPNVALLHLATSMIFFLAYEWMHLAYHLPPDHPVGRLGVVARLRELHRRHHDPRLMKRWNFNVTVPVFDWLHGTLWSEAREQARRLRRSGANRSAR